MPKPKAARATLPRPALLVAMLLAGLASACERTEEAPLWHAATGQWRTVPVQIKDGHAILGGDVDLGPIDELRERAAAQANKSIADPAFEHWPNGRVPYVIEAGFEQRNRALIQSVLRQWENGTGIRFVPRTTEEHYVNLVGTRSGTCTTYPYTSPLRVEAQDWCLAHEIGHALGLLHEHQRRDRDTYVKVKMPPWPRPKSQYRAFDDVEPCGPYDLASVMHYENDRITARPGHQITRKDNVVSDGDRRGLAAIYADGSCAS